MEFRHLPRNLQSIINGADNIHAVEEKICGFCSAYNRSLSSGEKPIKPEEAMLIAQYEIEQRERAAREQENRRAEQQKNINRLKKPGQYQGPRY